MKIVFISNYLNHHQLPVATQLYEKFGSDFVFIATEDLPEERKKLGYHDMNEQYSFCVCANKTVESWKKSERLSYEADVVIFAYSSSPIFLVKRRIRANRLTFFYMERLLKKTTFEDASFKRKLAVFMHHIIYQHKNVYILCASAYTPVDFARLGLYKGKTLKWGYFPRLENNPSKLVSNKMKIIWVGRYLDWKHPELVLEVAEKMIADGFDNIYVEMIGIGPMLDDIKKIAIEKKLHSYITFFDSMSPEEVRKHMQEANVFLMASDRQEGWGAVVNEAMNSNCVVVSGHLVGSVPYLIENGINGIIVETGKTEEYVKACELLYENRATMQKLAQRAVNSIENEWNAKNAVERLCDSIVIDDEGKCSVQIKYEHGPLSRAEVISEHYENV